MLSDEELLARATAMLVADCWIAKDECVDLAEGRYFPFRLSARLSGLFGGGYRGVIVHRRTGDCLPIGSGEREDDVFKLYERGYHHHSYDFVVTKVGDEREVVDILGAMRCAEVRPEFESGQIWRIRKDLTPKQIKQRLANLPAVFEHCAVRENADRIEQAARDMVWAYEALPLRQSAELTSAP